MALLKDPGPLPVRAKIEGVLFFPQKRYYCGPAALAIALAWTGLPMTMEDMVPQVYTPAGKERLPPTWFRRLAVMAASRCALRVSGTFLARLRPAIRCWCSRTSPSTSSRSGISRLSSATTLSVGPYPPFRSRQASHLRAYMGSDRSLGGGRAARGDAGRHR